MDGIPLNGHSRANKTAKILWRPQRLSGNDDDSHVCVCWGRKHWQRSSTQRSGQKISPARTIDFNMRKRERLKGFTNWFILIHSLQRPAGVNVAVWMGPHFWGRKTIFCPFFSAESAPSWVSSHAVVSTATAMTTSTASASLAAHKNMSHCELMGDKSPNLNSFSVSNIYSSSRQIKESVNLIYGKLMMPTDWRMHWLYKDCQPWLQMEEGKCAAFGTDFGNNGWYLYWNGQETGHLSYPWPKNCDLLTWDALLTLTNVIQHRHNSQSVRIANQPKGCLYFCCRFITWQPWPGATKFVCKLFPMRLAFICSCSLKDRPPASLN